MPSLNTYKPEGQFSGPIPGVTRPQEKQLSFSPNQPSVIERKTLRSPARETLSPRDVTQSFILYWEPYYTTGYINIPYREIASTVQKAEGTTPENTYKYRGIDLFLMNETDFNNFENNEIAVYVPISVGRYLILERFEMPKNIIISQKVSQTGKFVSVFNENFPRFSMQLRAVVFGSVHIKVKQFFDIVIKLITDNKPGRLLMYDVFGNVKISQKDIFLSLQYNKTPFYRLLPTNIAYSRSATDNTSLVIEVSGIVLEISNPRYI